MDVIEAAVLDAKVMVEMDCLREGLALEDGSDTVTELVVVKELSIDVKSACALDRREVLREGGLISIVDEVWMWTPSAVDSIAEARVCVDATSGSSNASSDVLSGYNSDCDEGASDRGLESARLRTGVVARGVATD